MMWAIKNERTRKWLYGTCFGCPATQRTSFQKAMLFEDYEEAQMEFERRQCGNDYKICLVKLEEARTDEVCDETQERVDAEAEYIDRQAVLDILYGITVYPYYTSEDLEILKIAKIEVGELHAIPAADVRENVKGEWLHVVEEIEGTTFRGCRCSKCNYWKGMGIFNFCPNCGADMRGEKDEKNSYNKG